MMKLLLVRRPPGIEQPEPDPTVASESAPHELRRRSSKERNELQLTQLQHNDVDLGSLGVGINREDICVVSNAHQMLQRDCAIREFREMAQDATQRSPHIRGLVEVPALAVCDIFKQEATQNACIAGKTEEVSRDSLRSDLEKYESQVWIGIADEPQHTEEPA